MTVVADANRSRATIAAVMATSRATTTDKRCRGTSDRVNGSIKRGVDRSTLRFGVPRFGVLAVERPPDTSRRGGSLGG